MRRTPAALGAASFVADNPGTNVNVQLDRVLGESPRSRGLQGSRDGMSEWPAWSLARRKLRR